MTETPPPDPTAFGSPFRFSVGGQPIRPIGTPPLVQTLQGASIAELIDELARRTEALGVALKATDQNGAPQHLFRRNGDKATCEGLAGSLLRQCQRDADSGLQVNPPTFGGPLAPLGLPGKNS